MFGKTTGIAALAAAIALAWAAPAGESSNPAAAAPQLTSPEYWIRAAESELDRAGAATGDALVDIVRAELVRGWLEVGRLEPALGVYQKMPATLRPRVADAIATHLLAEKHEHEQAARYFHVAGPMDRFSYVVTIAKGLRGKDPQLAIEFADRLPEQERQEFLARLAVIATQAGSLDLAGALQPKIKDPFLARMTAAAIEAGEVLFRGKDYAKALKASEATEEEFLDHFLTLDWREAKHLDAALAGKVMDRLSDPALRVRQRAKLARLRAAGGRKAEAKAALAAAERDLAEIPVLRRTVADMIWLAETKVQIGDVSGGLAVLRGLIEGRSKETAEACSFVLIPSLLEAGAYAEAQALTDKLSPPGRINVIDKWARHYIVKGQTGKVSVLLKAQPLGAQRAMVCLGVAQGLMHRREIELASH